MDLCPGGGLCVVGGCGEHRECYASRGGGIIVPGCWDEVGPVPTGRLFRRGGRDPRCRLSGRTRAGWGMCL